MHAIPLCQALNSLNTPRNWSSYNDAKAIRSEFLAEIAEMLPKIVCCRSRAKHAEATNIEGYSIAIWCPKRIDGFLDNSITVTILSQD